MYSVEVVQDLVTTVDPVAAFESESRLIAANVNRQVPDQEEEAKVLKWKAFFGVTDNVRGYVNHKLSNGETVDPIEAYKHYVGWVSLGQQLDYSGANEKVGLRVMVASAREARRITGLRNEIRSKRSFRNEVLSDNPPAGINKKHLEIALSDKEITDSFRTLDSNRHRREAVASMFVKLGLFAPPESGYKAVIEMTGESNRISKPGKADPTPESFAVGWVPDGTEIPRGMPLVKIISKAQRELSA